MGVIQWLSCISLLVGALLSLWGSAHWPPDKGWKCPVRGRGLAGLKLGWRALRPPPGRDKTQQGFLHANRHDPWTPHKEHHFRSYEHSVWESKEEPIGAGWGLWVPLRESDHWLYRGKKREQEGGKKTRGERKEIRGRFCVFVWGKGLVAKVQRASLLVQASPFPPFLLLLFLSVNGWRWTDHCVFQIPA